MRRRLLFGIGVAAPACALGVTALGCQLLVGLGGDFVLKEEEDAGVEAGPCADGKRNGDETGVDCGGSCGPCADGLGCVVGTDCESHVCVGGICRSALCGDGLKNGKETDVDCGGSACPGCKNGGVCLVGTDCEGGYCAGKVCTEPTCGDGVKNEAETSVDCGGGTCPGCANDQPCGVGGDCESGVCQGAVCVNYHVWSKRFGDDQGQYGEEVAVDGSGNVLVLGEFHGSIDFGGGSLINPCVPDPQDPLYCEPPDYFLAKLGTDGKQIWSKRFVNDNDVNAGSYRLAFALDGSGNQILVTHGTGAFNFGGGSLPDPNPCGMGCDIDTAIIKLDSSGKYVWGKRFGDGNDQFGWDVAASAIGDIAVTGHFAGSIDFGGGPLTSMGGIDGFVAKLSGSGAHVWSKRFGDNSSLEQYGRAVAVDSTGNVLLAGAFMGAINLGGGTLTSASNLDLFIAKFSSSGNHVWSKRFGNDFDTADIMGVVTDSVGNVYFAGQLRGGADFGGGSLQSVDGKDIFVTKFDLDGKHLWSKRFGDDTPQSMGGATFGTIAVDPAGSAVVTGTFSGTVDFGGGPLTSAGGRFVVKLDKDGNHVWSRGFAGTSGHAIAVDGLKALLMTGILESTTDFGGGLLTTAGGSDAFVAKFLSP